MGNRSGGATGLLSGFIDVPPASLTTSQSSGRPLRRSSHKYLAKPSLAGRKVSWSSLRNSFMAP